MWNALLVSMSADSNSAGGTFVAVDVVALPPATFRTGTETKCSATVSRGAEILEPVGDDVGDNLSPEFVVVIP